MFKFRRATAALVSTLIAGGALVAFGTSPVTASEIAPTIASIDEAVLTFNLDERERHVVRYELEAGTDVEIGAEPVLVSGLDGTWHVWGDNGRSGWSTT